MIDFWDRWIEDTVLAVTGQRITWHGAAMLIELPLPEGSGARNRWLTRLDQLQEINRALSGYRLRVREPPGFDDFDIGPSTFEVCQIHQDWTAPIYPYHEQETANWRLEYCKPFRGQFLTGYDPLRVSFTTVASDGYPIPRLQRAEAGSWATWMSVTDMEIGTMADQVREARGHVLVGGLGMGVYPALVIEHQLIESITVVENDPEVIEIVGPYVEEMGATIICDDLELYAATAGAGRFDYIFVDIWQTVDGIVPERGTDTGVDGAVAAAGRALGGMVPALQPASPRAQSMAADDIVRHGSGVHHRAVFHLWPGPPAGLPRRLPGLCGRGIELSWGHQRIGKEVGDMTSSNAMMSDIDRTEAAGQGARVDGAVVALSQVCRSWGATSGLLRMSLDGALLAPRADERHRFHLRSAASYIDQTAAALSDSTPG